MEYGFILWGKCGSALSGWVDTPKTVMTTRAPAVPKKTGVPFSGFPPSHHVSVLLQLSKYNSGYYVWRLKVGEQEQIVLERSAKLKLKTKPKEVRQSVTRGLAGRNRDVTGRKEV